MVPASEARTQLPQIAKGGIKSGETSMDAAFREVKEEVGLKKDSVEETFKVFSNDKMIVYAMKVEQGITLEKFTEETKEIVWKNELNLKGILKSHEKIIRKIIKKIKEKHG